MNGDHKGIYEGIEPQPRKTTRNCGKGIHEGIEGHKTSKPRQRLISIQNWRTRHQAKTPRPQAHMCYRNSKSAVKRYINYRRPHIDATTNTPPHVTAGHMEPDGTPAVPGSATKRYKNYLAPPCAIQIVHAPSSAIQIPQRHQALHR